MFGLMMVHVDKKKDVIKKKSTWKLSTRISKQKENMHGLVNGYSSLTKHK